MSAKIQVSWEKAGLHAVLELTKKTGIERAIARACTKAGMTALRDMRSEASKRVRARKALKTKDIAPTLTMRKGGKLLIEGTWAVDVSGAPVPLIRYPHREVGDPHARARSRTGRFSGSHPRGQGGVSVEVNRGTRTTLRNAFIARLKSGHEGIFERSSRGRLPITQLLGSRPVDALLHRGEAEAVAARGAASLEATFERLLPIEIGKVKT